MNNELLIDGAQSDSSPISLRTNFKDNILPSQSQIKVQKVRLFHMSFSRAILSPVSYQIPLSKLQVYKTREKSG